MVFEHDFNKFPELTNAQLEELRFVSPFPQIEEDFDAFVQKVHDGDTVTLLTSFRSFPFPLRIANIDAQELSEGGEIARDYLKAQIEGENVQVLINRNNRVGKYGRLIGEIVHRGLNMGDAMLRMNIVAGFGEKNVYMPEPVDKIFRVSQWLQ